jgi:hypothetical protein
MRLRVSLVLAVGLSLALVASATGTGPSGTKVKHLRAPILGLTIDGSRVAYFRGCCQVTRKGHEVNPLDKVMVWNLRTGRSVDVSGRQTHRLGVGEGGGFQVAMNGSEVAWTTFWGSNNTTEDKLFVSSLAKPKEHLVAKDDRSNVCAAPAPTCGGSWTGGLVCTGERIYFNQWTTNDAGTMANGSLLALDGKKPKGVADGNATVQAVSADPSRVAVLRGDGTVGLYTTAGKPALTVMPPSAREVAVNGRNLVVLEADGTLAVYGSATGSLKRTFQLPGDPTTLSALAVRGNVAVYSKPVQFKTDAVSKSAIHAINLVTGKDSVVGRLGGDISLSSIDSAGLVYASNGYGAFRAGNATLVFVPLKKVADAVS